MATRTWIGTIDSNWSTDGNWLEGVVPTASDDVIFDALSPACTITGADGNCLSLTTTNFANTLTIDSGYYLNVTYGSITLGSTTTIIGFIKWHSNASNSASAPNLDAGGANTNGMSLWVYDHKYYNLISNLTLYDFRYNSTINIPTVHFNCASAGLYTITILHNFEYYCGTYGWTTNINLYFQNNTQLISLGSNYLNNFSINNITFNGDVTLVGDIALLINTTHRIEFTANSNGVFGDYFFKIIYNTYLSPSTNGTPDIILNKNISIDCLYIISSFYQTSGLNVTFILPSKNITVNKKLFISGSLVRIDAAIIRSKVVGVNDNTLRLGNNCKYVINSQYFKDVSFNVPIKGFNCLITNCENITNGEYPNVNISVF